MELYTFTLKPKKSNTFFTNSVSGILLYCRINVVCVYDHVSESGRIKKDVTILFKEKPYLEFYKCYCILC